MAQVSIWLELALSLWESSLEDQRSECARCKDQGSEEEVLQYVHPWRSDPAVHSANILVSSLA